MNVIPNSQKFSAVRLALWVAFFSAWIFPGLVQAQKSAEVVLLDPVLATGPNAIDPEIPDPNGGIQDITVIADGAPTKADLTAVPGFHVMQDWKAGEGEDKVYFERFGVTESNVIMFSDPSLPTLTFSWNPEFPGDITDFSGFPTIGNSNPQRFSWTSGPLEGTASEELVMDAHNIFLQSATSGAGKGVGFQFVIESDTPLAAAAFTIPRSEETGKTEEEGETVWEAAFYNAAGDLLSRQTARPGEGANVAALFGYIAADGEAISKIVVGDIEEFYLAGGATGRMFFDDLGFAVAGASSVPPGNRLHNPVLATGMDALDPVAPAENAGLQDITVVADGASTKAELLGVPAAYVMQQFAAGEGDDRVYFVRRGDLDPEYNVVTFSDSSLPIIKFGWDLEFDGDASVWSGGASVGSGLPQRQSWTSGPTVRGSEENPADGDSIWLTSATAGAANGVGFRFVIEFDKPLAAAGFTLPRAEPSGRDVETEPETVWEAGFYDAGGNLLSRQTARPGDGTDVAALFGYVAGEGESISKIVIGDIEEWFLSGTATNRMFFDDLLFAVGGGGSGGQVLLDYDFSTPDRMTMDLPNAAPWYFWQHEASTATLEAEAGSIGFTLPPMDSWRPAGALIPFAEPGGVMLAVGEELLINAEITLDNVAFSEQGGFRWGVFNYGDGARPTGDDAVLGDFPGIGVTGYVNSMLFHGNQTNDQYWFAKRTGVEDDSLLGRGGNFSWFDMEGKYLTSFDAETQVFFPNEPIHIQLVYSRVAEDEVVLINTIMNAEGTILFQSEVSDTGLGEVGPYTTFDSFVFRAQVTGGSATGGVQGDPRAGVEEVISTMHFSEMKVVVRDIPPTVGPVLLDHDFSSGDRSIKNLPDSAAWIFTKDPASTSTLEAQEGSISWTIPAVDSWRPAGSAISFADPGGVTVGVGQSLKVKFAVTLDNITANTVGNQRGIRWGLFNFDGAEAEQPTMDNLENPAFNGAGTTGYHVSFSFHSNAENQMARFAKRTNLETEGLIGSFGAWTAWNVETEETQYLVELDPAVQTFFPEELYHVEIGVDRINEFEVHMTLKIMDDAGAVLFSSKVVDTGFGDVDPYVSFDTFVFRAQVSGGTATGSQAADPRAGIEEVTSGMHFTEMKVELVPLVPDIPLGDLPWQQEGLEIGDIVFDPWFGSFELGGNDWVRHGELGWLYVGFVEDSIDMWMYGLVRSSWLWSSESSFPIVYDYTAAKWIYYFLLPDGGGYYLYDYVTGNWGWNP